MQDMSDANRRSETVRRHFLSTWEPLANGLADEFRSLLEIELAATVRDAASDPGMRIHRPLARAWNEIGAMPLRRRDARLYGLSEMLFRHSLAREEQIESQHGRLHKGFSYHNMGLCQVLQGDWDAGIQNMRRAVTEDINSGQTENESHANRVLHEFVINPERDYIKQRIIAECKANHLSPVTPQTLNDLFAQMDLELRIHATYVIHASRIAGTDTSFGCTRRLDALRDCSHLLEVWLRKHGYVAEGLSGCLKKAYGVANPAWWQKCSELWKQLTWAQTKCKLNEHLSEIAKQAGSMNAHDLLVRAHLRTALLRNWTAHQFDPTAPVLNAPDYEELFDSIWVCLAYGQAQGI